MFLSVYKYIILNLMITIPSIFRTVTLQLKNINLYRIKETFKVTKKSLQNDYYTFPR